MESKFHRWWLGSCVAALLLASWVGGFSVAVTSVFIVIYLTGVTLIGPDEAPAAPVDVIAAKPVDVVAADPEWLTAYTADAAAVAKVDAAASSDASGESKAADEPATEKAITPEGGDEPPADTEAVIVDESDASKEELVVLDTAVETIEDAPDAEAMSVDGEDDAVLYPEDFDDEATVAEMEERSPA